ncbi:MAG: hypothetical protein WAqPseu_02670 [Shewanella algae]
MDELLDAITGLVSQVSKEKVKAIANQIRSVDAANAVPKLRALLGTPAAGTLVERLVTVWQNSTVSSDQLALMLISTSHVHAKALSKQSMELVWTGPTTPFVSTRRTEQALLQVINSAKEDLFLTSFVAYDVSSVVAALNAASGRGVRISILLELPQDKGGSLDFDTFKIMRKLVSDATFYTWQQKEPPYLDGRVHAKVAVADSKICFITSANLTGYALEKNMEAGVVIEGGTIPASLQMHLEALATTRIIVSDV